MSIERRKRKDGFVYRVQFRDERGRQRSRSFSLKRDAESYEAQVKLAKRRGELSALDAGKQPLREFVAEWWTLYAEPRLAASTRRSYLVSRDKYILPKLGHLQLRAVTPERVQQFQSELAAAGVGAPTIRRTLAILQGMFERAVEWDRVNRNPVRHVRKPPQGRTRVIRTLAPSQVERLRGELLRLKRHRDATLVSVLAYAGLRPQEALALRWGDVRGRTIVVDKALALGEEKSTKTRAIRTVRMLAPLASDLREWRLISRRPPDSALVFPTRTGEPWSEHDYRNWRRRHFNDAAKKVGLAPARPYDLRHSFASLLLAEQMNPAEIAGQLGHSLQTLFGTYAHVIEELRGQKRIDAEEEIKLARERRKGRNVAQKLPTKGGAALSPAVSARKPTD